MRIYVLHKTTYRFEPPAAYALQRAHLRPATNRIQTVVDWSLSVEHGQIEASYSDHYDNPTDMIVAERDTDDITFSAEGIVETRDTAGVLGFETTAMPLWHYRKQTTRTAPGKRIRALAQPMMRSSDKLSGLHELMHSILDVCSYEKGHTLSGTTAEEALSTGRGVCQDHAQIFLSVARLAGLPARYVSGYLLTDSAVGYDASHAWAEVFLDTLGWIGFDASNGQCPDARYIRLAVGLDSSEAAPLSGLRMGSGAESIDVSLQVQQ